MTLKTYVRIWILLCVALAWEAYALNFNTFVSFWAFLKENLASFQDLNLNPTAGKTISLWYGWTGLSLMLLTNLYVVRKRWSPLRKLGSVPGWLDFHIFCGLLGPTFILFHTNFKVGGLVAISFWSMVISFSSGVVGRYFYLQLVKQKTELEKEAETAEATLKKMPGVTMESLAGLESRALALAGGSSGTVEVGVLQAITNSFVGDLRMRFGMASLSQGLSPEAQSSLKQFARTKRRVQYLSQFQAVMGYWHSFHMPFAVFMYGVAVIHIAVALLLKVGR